jgi:hypothetical protein
MMPNLPKNSFSSDIGMAQSGTYRVTFFLVPVAGIAGRRLDELPRAEHNTITELKVEDIQAKPKTYSNGRSVRKKKTEGRVKNSGCSARMIAG